MGFWVKKYLWSNLKGLWMRITQIMCVICTSPCMNSNKHPVLGFVVYHNICWSMALLNPLLITLFICATDFVKLYVLVYVDDIPVTGANQNAIDSFVLSLNDSFHVKDLGELSFFLSVQASRDSNGLHLRQTQFIIDLLHSTHHVGAKPLNCPTISGPKLSPPLQVNSWLTQLNIVE